MAGRELLAMTEDEVTAFLGRTRYAREPDARGWRNGQRARQIQTAEGPLTIEVPQVRGNLVRFVSSVIPDVRRIIRTRPLEALVIGAYVRGLSDRDIEDLAREAGLGQLSRSSVSRLCRELRDPVVGRRAPDRAVHGRHLPAGAAGGSAGRGAGGLGLRPRR